MGVLILLLSITAGLQATGQTAPQTPPSDPAAASPSRLGGIWTFNKDLSTEPPAAPAPSDTAGRSGGSRRGGFSGGRGGRGGGGAGGGGNTGNVQQSIQQRALVRELSLIPQRLTIVVKDNYVEFTDDEGVVRKFTTDDKKESVDIGTTKVDSQSKWDEGTLKITLSSGSTKLTETFQVTVQGHMFVEELKLQNGNNDATAANTMKRIFDRVER